MQLKINFYATPSIAAQYCQRIRDCCDQVPNIKKPEVKQIKIRGYNKSI